MLLQLVDTRQKRGALTLRPLPKGEGSVKGQAPGHDRARPEHRPAPEERRPSDSATAPMDPPSRRQTNPLRPIEPRRPHPHRSLSLWERAKGEGTTWSVVLAPAAEPLPPGRSPLEGHGAASDRTGHIHCVQVLAWPVEGDTAV